MAARFFFNSQTNLGVMFSNGHGVPQDKNEAVKWYNLAADQGDVIAQSNLENIFADKEGEPLMYFKAIEWPKQSEITNN